MTWLVRVSSHLVLICLKPNLEQNNQRRENRARSYRSVPMYARRGQCPSSMDDGCRRGLSSPWRMILPLPSSRPLLWLSNTMTLKGDLVDSKRSLSMYSMRENRRGGLQCTNHKCYCIESATRRGFLGASSGPANILKTRSSSTSFCALA